jgi:hypothetical protein
MPKVSDKNFYLAGNTIKEENTLKKTLGAGILLCLALVGTFTVGRYSSNSGSILDIKSSNRHLLAADSSPLKSCVVALDPEVENLSPQGVTYDCAIVRVSSNGNSKVNRPMNPKEHSYIIDATDRLHISFDSATKTIGMNTIELIDIKQTQYSGLKDNADVFYVITDNDRVFYKGDQPTGLGKALQGKGYNPTNTRIDVIDGTGDSVVREGVEKYGYNLLPNFGGFMEGLRGLKLDFSSSVNDPLDTQLKDAMNAIRKKNEELAQFGAKASLKSTKYANEGIYYKNLASMQKRLLVQMGKMVQNLDTDIKSLKDRVTQLKTTLGTTEIQLGKSRLENVELEEKTKRLNIENQWITLLLKETQYRLHAANKDIVEKEKRIAEQQTAIDQQETTIKEQSAQIEQKDETIKQNERQIKDLRNQLDVEKQTVKQLIEDLTVAQNQIHKFNAFLQGVDAAKAALNK